MKKIIIPDNWLGEPIKGAMEKVLKQIEEEENKDKPLSTQDLPLLVQDYILLPQTNNHPDILISKYRLSLDNEVEQAAKKLSLNLNNNDRNPSYIGNINHQQALSLNKELNSFTLNPSLYVEFLNLLKKGNVLDGTKNKANNQEISSILDDILTVRSPWRAEWLDHKYSLKNNKLHVTYHKFDSSGKLIEFTEELDDDTLMNDKLPGISLESWLSNPTSQGLPRKNTKKGDIWYWFPRVDHVAGFDANSYGARLNCGRNPQYSDSTIGVRRASAV